ncbi:MAG: hypothetical protein ABIF12_03180 [bacterium]
MSKKILNILVLFSLLNFGLNIQTSYATENISPPINFSDLDLDIIELENDQDTISTNSSTSSFKEKLSLLAQILKEMTLKEKTLFISASLKNQIKEHKKECIIAASILTLAGSIMVLKYSKEDK